MNPYEGQKVLWHQDKILELRQGKQPVPVRAHLVVSDLCNQNCSFCSYRMDGHPSNQLFKNEQDKNPNNPNRMISREKATEIIIDLADLGVKAIEFQGGGEPTVHPDLPDLMQTALVHGMDIALVTNGVLINERLLRVLPSASWVRFSLDAGRPETYARVRESSPSVFDKVKSNIAKLVKARRSFNTVVIGVGFVVTRDTLHEMIEGARIAKELGADLIRFSPVFGEPEEVQLSYLDQAAGMADFVARTYGDDRFKVYNLMRKRYEKPDHHFCAYQHFTTYIGADLNVYRCCLTAYNERGLIGSIKEQTFRELWESQAKEEGMRGFDATGCGPCRFNEANRVVNYILDDPPNHVNYV